MGQFAVKRNCLMDENLRKFRDVWSSTKHEILCMRFESALLPLTPFILRLPYRHRMVIDWALGEVPKIDGQMQFNRFS